MTIVLNGSSGITNDGGYTGDGVVFADTTPANTLVTTTGGNVGIGTGSPSYPLDVAGAMRGNSWIGRANVSAPTADAAMYRAADNTLAFSTANTERARITSSGQVLIDRTTNTAGGKLEIYGDSDGSFNPLSVIQGAAGSTSRTSVAFYRVSAGGNVGTITTTNTATAYGTSSDYRLKEDIAPMTGALAKVALLKPCTYKWKVDGSDGEGFIAHELQAVVPDCVTGEKDAVDAEGNPQYQGIDTSFLVATLTAAIQEQQAIITALTARVAALEGTQP
jgi:hypothetical protein